MVPTDKTTAAQKSNHGIVYSCYHERSRGGEHFVPVHALGCVVSGSMIFSDETQEYPISEGSMYLVRRNQLLKFTKEPPPDGEFKSLSVVFDQDTLRNFSLEYARTKAQSSNHKPWPHLVMIDRNSVFDHYIHSLLQYHEAQGFSNKDVIQLKVKECLLLLLQFHPEVGDFLFDFSDPGKIDLEAYMNRHYHFNVGLDRFAYLTGRSLATFKRDFEKVYHTSPHRWLLEKRLNEALFLIEQKGKSSSEIYLDLGFEDLSHFSYSFKKAFGVSPTEVPKRPMTIKTDAGRMHHTPGKKRFRD